MSVSRLIVLVAAATSWASGPAQAQSPANIAVVINEQSVESMDVGGYYVSRRHIPSANVIRIKTSVHETVDRATYLSSIEEPIAAALSSRRLQDQILYIVLTKGVPHRISGTAGRDGTAASVDSELTLLYRRMIGHTVLTRGPIDNPYHLGGRSLSEARPFTHVDHDIFLVSRLDAFTAKEATALVDRCLAPPGRGHVVLDQRGGEAHRLADGWLAAAAHRLADAGYGDRVAFGVTPSLPPDTSVLGYYSWGSADPGIRSRAPAVTFAPGALAAGFVSTDARTFQEPPPRWVPSDLPSARIAGSGQSLVGDLIRRGVSGAAAHVAEPYPQSVVRPETVFLAYFSGFNLIESFYLALPHLSWQTVIVGDPLCRVAAREPIVEAELNAGIDPATGLPTWFSERQHARRGSKPPAVSYRAVTLMARARRFVAEGKLAAAVDASQQASLLAPQMLEPHLTLATLHAQQGEFDAAIDRYRKALTIAPDRVLSLNNLAYTLAVHRNSPQEALPYARRAVELAPTEASVLDTLAWVEHLLGDHVSAAKRITEAVRRSPDRPEIQLHAAAIYTAVRARAAAEAALKEALRLDTALADREDLRAIQTRLAEADVPAEPSGADD